MFQPTGKKQRIDECFYAQKKKKKKKNRPKLTKLTKCELPKKKLAWTDLDKVSFKKFVRVSKVKIEKLAWTGLDKVKKVSSKASVSSRSLSLKVTKSLV
jgi:hypothetical protein